MVGFYYMTFIRTTPAKLWKALTNPDFTRQYWWNRRLESDWKVRSEIKALHDGKKIDWRGKILIYKPFTKLSYTFHLEERPKLKNDKPSVVTFEINPAGKSIVKLTVTHERLSKMGFEDVSNGWPALLSSMKSLLESGKALKYD